MIPNTPFAVSDNHIITAVGSPTNTANKKICDLSEYLVIQRHYNSALRSLGSGNDTTPSAPITLITYCYNHANHSTHQDGSTGVYMQSFSQNIFTGIKTEESALNPAIELEL